MTHFPLSMRVFKYVYVFWKRMVNVNADVWCVSVCLNVFFFFFMCAFVCIFFACSESKGQKEPRRVGLQHGIYSPSVLLLFLFGFPIYSIRQCLRFRNITSIVSLPLIPRKSAINSFAETHSRFPFLVSFFRPFPPSLSVFPLFPSTFPRRALRGWAPDEVIE